MRTLVITTQGEKKINCFDEMIINIMGNKKFQAIFKEQFIRWRKLNILLVFIKKSYFSVSKDVRLNSTIKKNYLSAEIDYKDFMKIYRECAKEPYTFLTIDTTLSTSDLSRFRKNLFQSYKNDSSWSD